MRSSSVDKPRKKGRFYQGNYRPSFPEKYKGNLDKIVYRSFWERMFMKRCDNDPSIVEWSSEEIIIPYISPKDRKKHRYFVDFKVKTCNNKGVIKTYLVEVKPLKEVYKPVKRGKKASTYTKEVITYLVNQAKWESAKKYCDKRGWFFILATDSKLPKSVDTLNEKVKYPVWKMF